MGLVVKSMIEYQARNGLGGKEYDWIPGT